MGNSLRQENWGRESKMNTPKLHRMLLHTKSLCGIMTTVDTAMTTLTKKKQGQVDPSAHVSPYQWDADRFWNFKGNSEPRFRARRGSRLLHPFCSGCGNGNTGKWNHMPRNNVVISSSVKTQIHMPWVFDLVHCFLVYAVSWLAELVANQSFWRTSIYRRKGLITTFVCTPLTHLPPKEDYIVSFICSENIYWSFPVLGAQ